MQIILKINLLGKWKMFFDFEKILKKLRIGKNFKKSLKLNIYLYMSAAGRH